MTAIQILENPKRRRRMIGRKQSPVSMNGATTTISKRVTANLTCLEAIGHGSFGMDERECNPITSPMIATAIAGMQTISAARRMNFALRHFVSDKDSSMVLKNVGIGLTAIWLEASFSIVIVVTPPGDN
jgi:hypothetical protein